jgi:4-methylaminobutanoate oxidase (formaldehyde-forming)
VSVPSRARVVIVGGGIMGSSAAYHLAKSGWRDVVLLEQNEIGAGTTHHAAGMMARTRNTEKLTKITDRSSKLYASLEAETGVPTGWVECGSLLLARTRQRFLYLQHAAALARPWGIGAEEISGAEAAQYWPGIRTDDLYGAIWIPEDGKVDPLATARSLAAGARLHGANVIEGARVTDLVRRGDRITGVETNAGPIEAELVILAAGMWSRQLGKRAGLNIPLHPVEHHYAHLGPIEGVSNALPCMRDYDEALYFRPDGDGLWLGAFHPYPFSQPWLTDPVPDDFAFSLLEPVWEEYAHAISEGVHRFPALEHAGRIRFVNGPESFTPDGQYLFGPSPEVDGLFLFCGLNSVGIAQAGGAGETLAEWLGQGYAPDDLWALEPARFRPAQSNTAYLRARVGETLGVAYAIPWPGREWESARGMRKAPFHAQLAARGAVFGERAGWERPVFFAPGGQAPEPRYTFEKPGWFDLWAAEHRVIREHVALFDHTSFAKYVVRGPDACKLLNRVSSADIDLPPGKGAYTTMLTEQGTYVSDLVMLRVAEDEYYLVTAGAQQIHDADWIRKHQDGARAELVDVTSAVAVIGVHGPRSRELLQMLIPADLSTEAFPYLSSRLIEVGPFTVRAIRVSFFGELGWELHIPFEAGSQVFDLLAEAGEALDVAYAGFAALGSLRLEKSYAVWGTDLAVIDTPLEAGHGFLCAWDKPGGFIGREALLRQKEDGVRRRLLTFVLDEPETVLWGGEPIWRDGQPVGYLTSSSYGHTVGAGIGIGFAEANGPANRDWIRSGTWEIETHGHRIPATVHTRAPYDPERERFTA